ncbi:hypothetical protein H0H92_004866 [Tricholoma furcatifolium]|nr:hypothetical protein H0H92_004866 [Tricholoma furcatifolium]
MGPTTQLAISLGKTTAQIVAQFSLVPGLPPAVDLLLGIIGLCENVTQNRYMDFRNAARYLRDRAHQLLIAVSDSYRSEKLNGRMNAVLQDVTDCLVNIQTKMDGWVHLGKLQSFTMQMKIKAEIEDCLVAIGDCILKFQLLSQLEVHQWQVDFATSSKLDHLELKEALSDIQVGQEISNSKLDENMELTRQMMQMMQTLLAENKKLTERTHNGISRNLWQLQSISGALMPELHLKSGEVRRTSNQPIKSTSIVDIYEGLYLETEKVYVKSLRVGETNEHSVRRFKREVKIWAEIWRRDRGEFILPFYGFAQDDRPFPYMVSPWQKNGNLLEYVKAHDAKVEYLRMITRIALGTHFLHCTMKPPIVHGVIRAENIFINADGDPLLSDFGVSQIVTDISGIPFTQSHGVVQSYRWFAPELCVGDGVLSPSSDVYAYGMTVLEVRPLGFISNTPTDL